MGQATLRRQLEENFFVAGTLIFVVSICLMVEVLDFAVKRSNGKCVV